MITDATQTPRQKGTVLPISQEHNKKNIGTINQLSIPDTLLTILTTRSVGRLLIMRGRR